MILKLLLSTRMIKMIFFEILKNGLHKECKILIVLDNMIADLLSTKKHYQIVTKLFIGDRKLFFSLVVVAVVVVFFSSF